MVYSCIKCHKYWCSKEKYESLDIDISNLESTSSISHGLCPECLSDREDLVHRHQRKNGYSECFNREIYCTNSDCAFKTYCSAQSFLSQWQDSVRVLSR